MADRSLHRRRRPATRIKRPLGTRNAFAARWSAAAGAVGMDRVRLGSGSLVEVSFFLLSKCHG
jgi:hypothetical protein